MGRAALLFGLLGLAGAIIAAGAALYFDAEAHRAYSESPEKYRFDAGRVGQILGATGIFIFVVGLVVAIAT